MRGRGIGAGVVVALGALVGSCGGRPELLNGELTYSFQCTGDNPCVGGAQRWSGGVGQGDPPLRVLCETQSLGNGRTRFNLSLTRGYATEEGQGVHICGEAAGAGEVPSGVVDLYFNGDASERNLLPSGACRVRLGTLGADAVAGQLQCTGAAGEVTPVRMYTVGGSSAPPTTMDPAWADFSFTTCKPRILNPCTG